MAILEKTFQEDFDRLLSRVEKIVMDGSISATLEESADYETPQGRCSVRVFERYSYLGGNRVSMSVTLFQAGGLVHLCAITSGGSQAMFFKLNTWGEESFLDTLRATL
ncbi:MAG: hypothetical protein IJB47_02525 [Oscillospiraceae bacterium]|nr:hypothetical protein [Oscillospiraceae bacterium]